MANKKIKISTEQARNLSLNSQLLFNSKLPKGKTGVLRAIEKLGYVQIDTINVIERSHHIVFFTRCPDYQKDYLHDLQAKDKKIFEYWAHAASFIPMKDYRFYLPTMKRKPKKDTWLDKWIKKHRNLIKKTKERIVNEGPLTANNFKDVKNRKREPWWDWKPAKLALEVLFWQGILMIKERRNFQRVYDLTERVLPKDLDIIKPTEEEEKKFFVKNALNAMGIATAQDINKYIGISGKLNKWIQNMEDSKEIIKIEINGLKKPYYILPSAMSELKKIKLKLNNKVRFLSPFDNSIILRDRTENLFGFTYSLECYMPKNKRKYGYFSLPILWRNKFIGRIDPKVDRKNNILIINNLHLESKKLDYGHFSPAFSNSLKEFANFNKCKTIQLNKQIPAKVTRNIKKYL